MRFIKAALLLSLTLMLGCNKQEWFDKFTPKQEAEVAKQVVQHFATRDYVTIERLLSPNLIQPDTRSKLEEIAAQVPQTKPTTVQLVGVNTLKSAKLDQYTLTIQYQYPEKWLLANVVLQRNNGELRLAGIHVNQLADSLQNTNRFTFSGKGFLHSFVFLAAILVPLFILITIVACIKTPMKRRKWLWLLFIAIGWMQFNLDWTTGLWQFNPLSFLLLGSGFAQSGPVAPYVVTFALPIGAVIFWLKRKSLRTSKPDDMASENPTP